MGPPQISEELPGQTKPQSESSFANTFLSAFPSVIVSLFKSVFASVSVSHLRLQNLSVLALPSSAGVADLLLIEDAAVVKTLIVVQKQSLI